MELILFISSAFISVRARSNAIVRLENEEIDALLQGKQKNIICSGKSKKKFPVMVVEFSTLFQHFHYRRHFQKFIVWKKKRKFMGPKTFFCTISISK